MIACIGEILIDFIGKQQQQSVVYERYAGGAPYNVACAIQRFGGKATFCGVVGNDIHGSFLKQHVQNQAFAFAQLEESTTHQTTLAFVQLAHGERSFSFFRHAGADAQFERSRLSEAVYASANIVHFGSLLLSQKKGIKFARSFAKEMKKMKKKISFDVNYREDIYASEAEAKRTTLSFMRYADIIKISDEEIKMLSNEQNLDKAIARLFRQNQRVFVTLGKKGSYYAYRKTRLAVKSFEVESIDTTGAGDAFYGALLTCLDQEKESQWNRKMEQMMHFANAAGALTTLRYGAIDALPTRKEIEAFLKQV